MGRVAVQAPDTVSGFILRERLMAELGAAPSPDLILAVTLTEERDSAAVTPDGDITRFTLVGRAVWELRDSAQGQMLASGEVTTFSSYSATGSTVATLAAERAARERQALALADLVRDDLLLRNLP